LTGSIKGRNNLYNHLESAIKNAESSIIIMTSAAGLVRKSEALRPALEKAAKKGVKIKIAAPISNEQATKAAKEFSAIAEVRNITDKGRFCLIDGKELLFMLNEDDKVHPSYDTGVWVNTKLFASAVENFFNASWSRMKPTDKFNKAA
jgi:sugar-specific transcriptional regulator TrmB